MRPGTSRERRGPGVIDAFKVFFSKIPSEELLTKIIDDLPRLEELLPRLERIIANPTIEKIARLTDFIEDGRVDRLEHLVPLLQNIPENSTLVDIANMKPYLANLPSHEELRELIELMRELRNFMGALKGAGGR